MSQIIKRSFHSTLKRYDVITTVCPGQGNVNPHLFTLTQYQIDILNNYKYRNILQQVQETLPDINIIKYFSKKTYPDSSIITDELSKTSIVQPLVLLSTILNYSIFKDIYDWDVNNSNYMLGHSLGELSSLVLQDVISFENGLKIAYKRGKLMEDTILNYNIKSKNDIINNNNNNQSWGMVALMFQERDFRSVLKVCDDIKLNIANINGYGQIVVSGKTDELNLKLAKLNEIQQQLLLAKRWKSRIRKTWLQTKIPAHHPVFDDIKEELRSMIHLKSDILYIPVVCNLNGLVVVKNSQRVVDNFIDVTSKPVKFVDCLESIVPFDSDKDELYKFLNVSDVTHGLIKRFFNNNKNVQSYDLIAEAEKELV